MNTIRQYPIFKNEYIFVCEIPEKCNRGKNGMGGFCTFELVIYIHEKITFEYRQQTKIRKALDDIALDFAKIILEEIKNAEEWVDKKIKIGS